MTTTVQAGWKFADPHMMLKVHMKQFEPEVVFFAELHLKVI